MATLKKNYRCFQSLQQFYSGGPYAVSSDGSFLACACDDTIKIVDSSNAAIKSTIEGDSEPVTALILSPDDKILFSASHSRQIRVWDLSTLKCIRSWKGHEGPVMGMACHASGGLLATAGADKKVQVWDVDGGFCTHYFKGHKGVVSSVIFHPDPNRLLLFSGGDDAIVKVWDLTSKKCVATLEKHQSTVTSIAISEDGWTLLTAGRDKVVNIWNLHDYRCTTTVPTYEALEAVCAIDSASPFASGLSSITQKNGKNTNSSSNQFITVGERGIVRIWNSEGAVLLFEQKSSDLAVSSENEEVKRGFTSTMLLPLGQGLLCATVDQQFLIYDLDKHDDGSLNLVLRKRLIGYNEEIADMKFLGEEEQFIAVATSVEQVRVYDLASMSCLYVLTGHTDIVLSLDTCVQSSGRTLIATGSKDNTVRLWDPQNQRCVGVGVGHMGGVGAVAFSHRTLKVWSLDGISSDIEEVYHLKAKAVVAAHDKDINSVAIAPNDSLVCSGSQDRTACIWRLPDLVSVVVLKGHKRGIWSVEFSPVDQCVITASGDKTIKIWAISDGSCLRTFEGHTASVVRASFITRGTQFVSCGGDGLVKLWTVKTNECVATYDQHEEKAWDYYIPSIWALAIGKKTEMLATGGGDAVINLWHDSTAADRDEEEIKKGKIAVRGIDLENAENDKDYTRAIQLAFELRRPHKLLDLFCKLCRKTESDVHIKKALSTLAKEKEELRVLLEYIREWNSKPKNCHVAQFVLQRVFSIFPPTEIVEMKGIGEVLEGLIPYSRRHFTRIDRLERSTFLLDYTLTGMSVIEPESNETESKDDSLKQQSNVEEERVMMLAQPEDDYEPKDVSRKKRKLHKSQDRKHKKTKVAYLSAEAIPSQA
ncbi:hypothetical protein CASFOL_003487 [Castilleja foliolosa]|uniref:U3 small nucleolar RNA-associated protein 13 C-terminal domain-containing protein n=1 Tax=Castilleja foliolosa TaxID=1961234 RepID=A0ABD3EHY6_9LAMI